MYEHILDKPILLPHKGNIYKPVILRDIIYAKVDGAYIVIKYVNGSTVPFELSMSRLQEMLPPTHFCRISRNYLVSITHIDFLEKNNHTITISKESLPLSENFRKEFYARYLLPV
ncbi:transcriptional regulator, LytTR family [Chitinophaga sp. YR627]|uniref:LytR/AlgR family response regulator transcription factor n=1 Tax=Chitinophaga sp. YR627 TaxID=1881041 RepID=UPI0008E863DC|nr:LytTR family DNA-binding domain-containing protein [Chitinophaga sp. YR627]SFN29990.1 transcriptional regulator, LytTR family [Chitinophaga sp. YR627]